MIGEFTPRKFGTNYPMQNRQGCYFYKGDNATITFETLIFATVDMNSQLKVYKYNIIKIIFLTVFSNMF